MELRNFKPRSEWGKQLLAEGKAEGKAEGILIALETRGIVVDGPSRQQILSCTDATVLDAWMRRAVTVASLDELLHAHPAAPMAH